MKSFRAGAARGGIFICEGLTRLVRLGRGLDNSSQVFATCMTKQPLAAAEVTEMIVGLNRLARNLWWTWNQESQEIFQELSPRGWQNLYHNAVAVLHEVSDEELRARMQDPDFGERVRRVLKNFED